MSEPQTVIQALESTGATHAERAALRFKRDGSWQSLSWREYLEQVYGIARGLIALGVEAGAATVILADNGPGWFVAHFGSIAAGAMPTGIYTNNTPEQCRFIADHCEAVVAFAGSPRYLEKLLAIRQQLPRLRAIVLMNGQGRDSTVLSWSDLLAAGNETADDLLRDRLEGLDPRGVCELIYTSGTTGTPKAVMLTHRNIVWVAEQVVPTLELRPGDALISYLPLSHIAEQVISLYGPIFTGACTWFAESLDTLADNLREVRPRIFFAVPRVWEKIQMAMVAAGRDSSAVRRRLVHWARRQGLAGGYAEQAGRRRPIFYRLADRLVFSKVRERLGLDRCRDVYTAAAPISRSTLDFFLSLGMPILEVYGMSENTGPATLSTRDAYRTGKAGRALPGSEIKIAPDGEICMRGPHVSPGYFKNPEATREAFDADGWLRSGDVGELDEEGFLTITDRKKELIITSGGKNVAPQIIEKQLEGIPLIGQAVVIGDRRNYLTALFTLDPATLPDTAEQLGSAARDLRAAADCPLLRRHLEDELERVNRELARFETIKRFAVLPVEFSVDGGEMTPTMKLKRRVIETKYAAEIDVLYA